MYIYEQNAEPYNFVFYNMEFSMNFQFFAFVIYVNIPERHI